MNKDISKLVSNIVFDDKNKIPNLKKEIRVEMVRLGNEMFFGEFGWAIGSKTGLGTAHIVSVSETILERK